MSGQTALLILGGNLACLAVTEAATPHGRWRRWTFAGIAFACFAVLALNPCMTETPKVVVKIPESSCSKSTPSIRIEPAKTIEGVAAELLAAHYEKFEMERLAYARP